MLTSAASEAESSRHTGIVARWQERVAGEPWQVAAAVAVMIGVAFSVLLMSVAFGVAGHITKLLSNPVVKQSHVLNVSLINQILALLTVVVTAAMLAQTAAATFTLGVTVMRSRREEVAIRRQSGVLRSSLLLEFLLAMLGRVSSEASSARFLASLPGYCCASSRSCRYALAWYPSSPRSPSPFFLPWPRRSCRRGARQMPVRPCCARSSLIVASMI